ncbi:MAG TPA: thiamine diphosphokinase [Sedimentibacter sp.]|jgi:thiamine pyrophosphokinase|nr:thiamine diphosphokinase [Tissierellia bacterium]HAS92468.1 thiamine diphosphokinase [Clostridiales bacterium]HOA19029.1 thiamine diphosphokinase [Sedimentibacter sp.]HOG62013.1 thiamine diphosphokinase [Sedimentibacter sp.]HPB78732.1 thiamine diphosphokinase [Sedimentibacter sp.]
MKTALIVGNGDETAKRIIENIKYDYLICADGGLEKVSNYGIIPDIIIGDFDSVASNVLKQYENRIPIEKFPSEKDFTDMELAVELAVSKGYKNIILTGASGSRLDHTLGNILLMEKYFKDGVNISIIDNNNEMKIISDNSELFIEYKEGYFISIIPITDSIQGLCLEGFKYNLDNVDVERGSTLCISNQIKDNKGKITLKKGRAIVIISKD